MSLKNSNAQKSFAEVPAANTARSRFNRSQRAKDTMDFDYITPIFVDEVLPGDTVAMRLNSFCRLSTPLKPAMDNAWIDYEFFFVPSRLVWSNWRKFLGEQDNPGDSISYTIPTVPSGATGFTVGTIYDNMGLPAQSTAGAVSVNSLPLRCYNLIIKEWYRDQNLSNSPVINTGDGPDLLTDYALVKRAKYHDYFTSLLPSPQKGSSTGTVPLGTSAPVLGLGVSGANSQTAGTNYQSGNGATIAANTWKWDGTAVIVKDVVQSSASASATHYPNIYADLSSATSASINQLRQAFLVQQLLEKDARGGTRLIEIIKAHFNVTVPDFRLQRPEFLGGGRQAITSHPIPQQSSTSGSNYLGQLAAFGTSQTLGEIGFNKSFVEHGYILGLATARAEITYQQGLERMWSRSTKYDFYWPTLDGLGEQSVLTKEIYCNGDATDSVVLGYQERYAEYRYKPNQIRGQFRSTYSTPLDSWHYAEKFTSAPTLNNAFILSNTPITRTLATADGPDLLCDYRFDYMHIRPMPVFSIPVTLGRF